MYEFAVTPAVTQLRRPGVTIESVDAGSLAEELELAAGDRIVRVNRRTVRDYLDFRFQTSGETELVFLVKKPDGETWEVNIERDEDEDFGLNFEQIIPRQCANECIFCFCKGNPEDARPSLFVRDEDIRLSFLYGNYTTLTSITEDEMVRIIEQRLSPQYVSVHATDLKTRSYLLGVDEAKADIADKIQRLLSNNIEIHAQVVLCPGINDGSILVNTLRDLAAMHPGVVSTAVVPVALTRYNKDERLTPVSPEFCTRTISEVESLQREFMDRFGTNFAFLGDEIYLKAGHPIPPRSHYGDYPQIEDGVGMVRTFINEIGRQKEEYARRAGLSDTKDASNGHSGRQKDEPARSVRTRPEAVTPSGGKSGSLPDGKGLRGTIITGEMFAPVLCEVVEAVNRLTGKDLEVLSVPNTYFGGDVAVAGLITGQDILAVADRIGGEFVLVPEHIIKSDEPILLDGLLWKDVKSQLPVPAFTIDIEGLNSFLFQD